jgi:hypothetical protein
MMGPRDAESTDISRIHRQFLAERVIEPFSAELGQPGVITR